MELKQEQVLLLVQVLELNNMIGQIIQGHLNELTNKENELYIERIAICRRCPLLTKSPIGEMCDASKCIDTNTNLITTIPQKGTICGCGCRLSAKTRVPNAKCVLGKW